MTMPNFLIIGAMKSGTTSLYYYLKQHPQIYMSAVKEPNFFALEGEKLNFNGPEGPGLVNRWICDEATTTIEEYRSLFEGVSSETAIGEASPWYLYSPEAPSRIRRYIPEAKLIVVLRNPVDRAYSAFSQFVRDGREPLNDFTRALQAEEERIRNNWKWIWHYKKMGFYYGQLKRYYGTFEQEQIRVYLYEELNNNPTGVLQDVFRYLGVDDTFTPDISRRLNVSGAPKSKVLFAIMEKPNPVRTFLRPFLPERLRRRISTTLQNINLIEPEPLRQEIRRELIEVYRPDVLKLQHLIKRDLSGWLEY